MVEITEVSMLRALLDLINTVKLTATHCGAARKEIQDPASGGAALT